MRERLVAIAARIAGAATPAAREFAADSVLTRYREPHRAYHNLNHIADCLTQFDALRSTAEQPVALELAIWFHDVVYDVRRSDNELRSAEFATNLFGRLDGDTATIARVHELILATTHRDPPMTNDARLIVDIDLSILASQPERYEQYCRQIRDEYSFATDEQFAAGRSKFLDMMLAKPAIYHTVEFAACSEESARRNMQRERAIIRGDR